MENFAQRRQHHRVELLTQSTNGTLHFQYDERTVPIFVIEHLDGPIPPSLGSRVPQLVEAIRAWLSRRGLDTWVYVDAPLEVHEDFLVWPFRNDFDPIHWWDEPELPDDLGPLPELANMRTAVEAALRGDAKVDPVVRRAVERSLLGPSERTYFDAHERRFIVVQPLLDRDELASWTPGN